MNIFEKINSSTELTRDDLKEILSLENDSDLERLFNAAYEVKTKYVGRKVYLRGLIEISNICSKDCYYCGIRRGNTKVHRYMMADDDVIAGAKLADKLNLGSIVLQGGEISSDDFTLKIENILKRIRIETGDRLGITLSLGEQSEATYRRWFEAGAHRYLLRIEASNKELYGRLHPQDHSWDERYACLKRLQKVGYQTGTGTMSGLPHQTDDDLVSDLIFFKENDIDMIGMGPYLVHEDTPLAKDFPDFEDKREIQLKRGLKMIAAARIFLKDVNIASTTALQALRNDGRELGLLAGANIIMPNISLAKYKVNYNLYEGKPGLDDGPGESLEKLVGSIESIGESVAFGQWGDPRHFFARKEK